MEEIKPCEVFSCQFRDERYETNCKAFNHKTFIPERSYECVKRMKFLIQMKEDLEKDLLVQKTALDLACDERNKFALRLNKTVDHHKHPGKHVNVFLRAAISELDI